MDNGGGLRLTTAYYYTPYGRHIDKKGIEPDVDLKEEVQKQIDEETAEEAKNPDKTKQKKSRLMKDLKANLEKDVVVQKALEWLKSDVTVKEYKEKHPHQPVQETAKYDE